MTLPSDWKMGKCLEWYTEVPFPDRPRESPVFLIQNVECSFQFKRQSYSDYVLYLKPKTLDAELKSFPLTIYSNHLSENRSCIVNFSGSNQSVMCFSEDTVKKRGANVGCGYFVKFLFVFGTGDGPSLPLDSKSDDKCIQTASYLNPDLSIESLNKDFSQLLSSGLNHNVQLKCGEETFKAHKIVLCARSVVFKAMLENDMEERRTGIVEIKDVDARYFQDFVRYLYTDAMPELTLDEATVLYEAGDKYGIKSLMLRCSEYLRDNLSRENAFKYFELADAHSDQKLKDGIQTYILDQKIYLEDEYWSLFCKRYPEEANEVYRLSFKRMSEDINFSALKKLKDH